MEDYFIEIDKMDDHTDDTPEIKVSCSNCGKEFYIKKQNVYVGDLFCSDKCRAEDYENWHKDNPEY